VKEEFLLRKFFNVANHPFGGENYIAHARGVIKRRIPHKE